MNRQFKQLPYFAVKGESTGRIRKGICAVFGNVDSWGDRIQPGAFAKTIAEGSNRVKHLWNHDFGGLPIAKVIELKELRRDELPQAVLDYCPEATGGLMVSREYDDDSFSDSVMRKIDKGIITEMSFGYDVIRSAETVEGEKRIRELLELKLYDTSDVIWGMNDATLAVGAKSAMPIGVIAQNLQFISQEIKAGRRNADADMKLIKSMHESLVSLGYESCQPIEEEPKSDEPKPSVKDTSLSATRLKLQRLKAGILTN